MIPPKIPALIPDVSVHVLVPYAPNVIYDSAYNSSYDS